MNYTNILPKMSCYLKTGLFVFALIIGCLMGLNKCYAHVLEMGTPYETMEPYVDEIFPEGADAIQENEFDDELVEMV